MGIILGANQYGKAEVRVVKVDRDTPRHEIHDLSVTTTLRGDFADAHTSGDQSHVLPTDSQKNTVFAFAKQYGVGQIEDFALSLARHFTETVPAVTSARVGIEAYDWDRVGTDAEAGHDHAFVRRGQDVRTTAVTAGSTSRGPGAWVTQGSRTWSCCSRPDRGSEACSRTGTRRWPRPTTGSWPPAWWRGGGSANPPGTGLPPTPVSAP